MRSSAPAPALSDEEIGAVRRNVQREHKFQAVVDRFLDRVVLPPMWCTGINHENELTDNARSRAAGRGVKSGVPDVYVCQATGRSTWLELKWGKNDLSGPQKVVRGAMTACGIHRVTCWSIDDVLKALRLAGMALHPNADNLAVEYQARAETAVREAEAKAARPYKPGRARKPQVSRAAAARGNAWTAARLGLG